MTWLKLSDDFPDDLYRDDLSDAAFRTHVEGLAWSCRHLLDGRLPRRSLPRFGFTEDLEAAAAELVAAGYWQQVDDGWQVVHHLEHQATRDTVLRRRKVDADRQARSRERRLHQAESRRESDRESRRDTPRDDMRDPGRDGTGRDGSGQVRQSAATNTVQERDEGRDVTPVGGHGSAGDNGVTVCGWCSQKQARTEPDGRPFTIDRRAWCGLCEPVDDRVGQRVDTPSDDRVGQGVAPPSDGPGQVCTVAGCGRPATLTDSDGGSLLCDTHEGAAFGTVRPLAAVG